MSEPSPYQPPLPQGPASIPPAMLGEPPAVKVFGILHLVFAGIGLIGAVWGLVIAAVGNPFLKFTPAGPELDAQIALQEKINPMTLTSGILSLLVAVPMIVAGIQLLRKRKNGLKWSNTYAWSSLGAKLINLVLAVTIMIPAMQEMTQGILAQSKAPSAVSGIMSGFMAAGTILGIVITCVYPILTLVLLNRPATKTWFASLTK
ncbi:MAG: hypothetical protein V4819_07000 [Verrucomicrobiota bacterium]